MQLLHVLFTSAVPVSPMELIPWVAQSVNLWKWQMYRNCDFPPCQDGSFFKRRYVYCTYVSLFKLSFIFNIYLTNRGIYQSISDDKKTTAFLKHSHFFFFLSLAFSFLGAVLPRDGNLKGPPWSLLEKRIHFEAVIQWIHRSFWE